MVPSGFTCLYHEKEPGFWLHQRQRNAADRRRHSQTQQSQNCCRGPWDWDRESELIGNKIIHRMEQLRFYGNTHDHLFNFVCVLPSILSSSHLCLLFALINRFIFELSMSRTHKQAFNMVYNWCHPIWQDYHVIQLFLCICVLSSLTPSDGRHRKAAARQQTINDCITPLSLSSSEMILLSRSVSEDEQRTNEQSILFGSVLLPPKYLSSVSFFWIILELWSLNTGSTQRVWIFAGKFVNSGNILLTEMCGDAISTSH